MFFDSFKQKDISSSRNANDNVIVVRRGEPSLDSQCQGNEVYSGEENPLMIFVERRIQFSCSFDNIKNFPFGKQKCSVKFHFIGVSNLIETCVQKESAVDGQGGLQMFLF